MSAQVKKTTSNTSTAPKTPTRSSATTRSNQAASARASTGATKRAAPRTDAAQKPATKDKADVKTPAAEDPKKPSTATGLVDGVKSWASDSYAKVKGGLNSAAKTMEAMGTGLQAVQTAQGLKSLMEGVQKEGLTPANIDKLNGFMKDANGQLDPQKIEQAKQMFPPLRSYLESPEMAKMQQKMAENMQDLSTIHAGLGQDKLGGEDLKLNRDDVCQVTNGLLNDGQMQNKMMDVAHDLVDQYTGHRPVINRVVHRYVGNRPGMVMDRAQQEISGGLDRTLAGFGMAPGHGSNQGRTIGYQDLDGMYNAGRRLAGLPRESLSTAIDRGVQNPHQQPPTIGQVQNTLRQEGHAKLDNSALGESKVAHQALEATINSLPSIVQGGIAQEDIRKVWETQTHAYNALAALRGAEPAR